MSPPEAAEYFKTLCAKRFAGMAGELSHELREFGRNEAARGQFSGSGHTGRIGGLFHKQLEAEAKAIVAIQREVHAGFDSPLGALSQHQVARGDIRAPERRVLRQGFRGT
jgi:hypothetical protein